MSGVTMVWRFADGTDVQLGGVVTGSSKLAERLREQLELLPTGRARRVPMRAQPGGDERLVPSSPYHVDGWCRIWAHLEGVELIEAPELPSLIAAAPTPAPAGTVY